VGETRDVPPDTLSDEEIGTAGPGGDRLSGGDDDSTDGDSGDDDSTDGDSGDDSESSDADVDDA
jgi:hypothetical protein